MHALNIRLDCGFRICETCVCRCRCDRVLSYGTGMKLLSYRRSELKLSDHRPVTATYTVEVEVFSPRRLQRALTFTDAEVEQHDIVTEMALGEVSSRLILTYSWRYMILKHAFIINATANF